MKAQKILRFWIILASAITIRNHRSILNSGQLDHYAVKLTNKCQTLSELHVLSKQDRVFNPVV